MIFESGINMDILSLREYAYLNMCGSIVVRQTQDLLEATLGQG